jgi:hypothetical protein
MKTRAVVLGSLVALLAVGVACYAGPFGLFSSTKPAPAWRVGPHDVKIKVETSERVNKPTLLVPRTLLVNTAERRAGVLPAPSVVGGVALSAALALGGLWLAGRGRRVAAGVVVLALFGVGAGALFADIPGPFGRRQNNRPPPYFPPPPAPEAVAMPATVTLPQDVRLEVVDSGDTLRLVMPAAPAGPPLPASLGAPRPVGAAPGR